MSLAIAISVALYGLGQYTGAISGSTSVGARIDSSLGNSAYMAIYMLFHIFILFWLFVRSKVTVHKVIYALAAALLAYVLLLTGTRGTFLGFVGGSAVMVGYIALFGRAFPEIRKVAIGVCLMGAVLVGGFFTIKDSDFVQNQGSLARIANISLSQDLLVRGTIWKMAFEGVKERPLLGWGQGNFNYVFNKQYDPSLYGQESWFDRTHDIVFDWLIAGGILGFLGYFSIFFAALYYLFWQPLFKKDEEPVFNVLERGVLIGLLVGYMLHNVVVFDNIISYIFYGAILALVHSRVSKKIPSVESVKIDPQLVGQFFAPIIFLIVVAVIYFVNVPGILAAKDIIHAMQAPTVKERLVEFHTALGRHSFADQEIVEQLAQQAMSIVRSPNVGEEEKKAMVQRAELELLRMIKEKPGDARLHSFLSSYYRTIGAFTQAQEQSAIARELSPNKQAIITEQAIIELQLGNVEKATEYFKTAFELYEENTPARVFYAAMLVGSQKIDEARTLLGTEYFTAFAVNDFALSMADQSKDRVFLAEVFEARVAAQPQDPQNRASLAYVYYELGQIPKAIDVLNTATLELATTTGFAERAQCYISNLEKGVKPDEGC